MKLIGSRKSLWSDKTFIIHHSFKISRVKENCQSVWKIAHLTWLMAFMAVASEPLHLPHSGKEMCLGEIRNPVSTWDGFPNWCNLCNLDRTHASHVGCCCCGRWHFAQNEVFGALSSSARNRSVWTRRTLRIKRGPGFGRRARFELQEMGEHAENMGDGDDVGHVGWRCLWRMKRHHVMSCVYQPR